MAKLFASFFVTLMVFSTLFSGILGANTQTCQIEINYPCGAGSFTDVCDSVCESAIGEDVLITSACHIRPKGQYRRNNVYFCYCLYKCPPSSKATNFMAPHNMVN
ncbi:hypothetical protein ABFS82_02G044800 [Erythranthe guttata]